MSRGDKPTPGYAVRPSPLGPLLLLLLAVLVVAGSVFAYNALRARDDPRSTVTAFLEAMKRRDPERMAQEMALPPELAGMANLSGHGLREVADQMLRMLPPGAEIKYEILDSEPAKKRVNVRIEAWIVPKYEGPIYVTRQSPDGQWKVDAIRTLTSAVGQGEH